MYPKMFFIIWNYNVLHDLFYLELAFYIVLASKDVRFLKTYILFETRTYVIILLKI